MKCTIDLINTCLKIFFFSFKGECCVALRSLTRSSEQFETFLSHRGEEMGSIRGWVRVHVPKDKRVTREKIYGRSAGTGAFLISALLALSLPTKLSSPLSLLSLTLLWVSHCFLYLVPQWSLAWLYTCWYLSTTSSFGSWLTDPDQMHPETQDRWVLWHQVRYQSHTSTTMLCDCKLTYILSYMHHTGFEKMLPLTKYIINLFFVISFQSGSV